MKKILAAQSLIVFGLSLLFWIVLTLSENALVGISLQLERVLTFILLVVPALFGAALGVLGVVRRAAPVWLALLGAILNGLFGLFHLLLLAFAG